MLISPPFIPASVANETDQDYLDRAMIAGEPGNGAFPVSYDMGWHGGVHLAAPQVAGGFLPVRAIADGKIAFFRQPSADQDSDALNYGGGWTDNGCLVIKHETDIGEGAQANVVFYSIYMHLSSISLANISVGLRVYRKDKLGVAGSIYGKPNKIHFEVICGQDQISKITGRSTCKLGSGSGRTDSCWGNMYFQLPPEAILYADRPADPKSSVNTSAVVYRPEETLFLRMSYKRGQCKLSVFNESGVLQDERADESDYEYNLYTHASKLYSNCTSAGYELLRFGRVLSSDSLQPADCAHWRKITSPNGPGWINLNGPTITMCSDADFPHWQGWMLIDDDTNGDGRCQSKSVLGLLGIESAPVTSEERERCRAILSQPEMYAKISRLVCKFPTEWKKENFSDRFGWLKDGETPIVSNEIYERLKSHYEALAFWEEANLEGIDAEHWHFPPKQFVALFRQCGWLSLDEMMQVIPTLRADAPGEVNNATVKTRLTLEGSSSQQGYRPAGMHLSLNKMMRKYNFSTSERISALFSQALTETDLLRTTREYGNTDYFTRGYEGRCNVTIQREVPEWGPGILNLSPIGNCSPGDGPKYIGRGVIQMTGRELYSKYGAYRGKSFVSGTSHLDVSDVADNACDSAGYYWIKEDLRDKTPAGPWVLRGVKNIHREADALSGTELSTAAGLATADTKILSLTRQINRASLHLARRRHFFKHAYYFLSELVSSPPSAFHKRSL
jgi:hydroxyethylthiazole kinase